MRVIFWLGVFGCVACGGTEKSAPKAAGGAAGQASAQAGAPAQSGAGGAGSGGADSGGASLAGGGSSVVGGGGNVGVGGGLAVPCGGDVTGNWTSVVPAAAKSHPSSVDACFDLALTRNRDGSLGSNGRFWVDYHATPVTTYLTFRPPVPGSEASYSMGETYRGTVVQDYADECLADGQGKATCAELSSLLTNIGLGEGAYPNVTCVAGAAGGCSCTIQVLLTGGPAGAWSVDAEDPTRLVISSLSSTTAMYEPHNVPYCVDAAGLHFGVELEQAWPFIASLSFTKVDCADGIQGPAEEGPDCGAACATSCK